MRNLDEVNEEIEKLKDKIKQSVGNIELLKEKLVEYETHLEELRTDFKGKFGSEANEVQVCVGRKGQNYSSNEKERVQN